MEEKENMSVPYIVYEGAQARHERTIKRMVIIIIILISMLFANNAIWLYAWMQYDYVDGEVQQVEFDSGDRGINNFIGNDLNGELKNYGEDEGDDLQGESSEEENRK